MTPVDAGLTLGIGNVEGAKNADCVPPEIELKNEIRRTEDLLAGMEDTAEKYRTMKKLNFLIMKLNAAQNGPVELEIPQQYSSRLLERLDAGRSRDRRNKTSSR